AGGIRSKHILDVELEEVNTYNSFLNIAVRGLKGGHSGMEINKERGNSNKIMGRILKSLSSNIDFRLVSLNGGSKNNAIPREADALVAIKADDIEKAKDIVIKWNDILLNELKTQDPGVNISISESNEVIEKVFTKESTDKAINLLYLIPNGINTNSLEIDGLVESSTNLGVVTTNKDKIEFDSAIRSSVASLKDEIVLRSKTVAAIIGAKFKTTAGYPEWQYDSDSKVREICQDVHKRMYGKDAKIVAIHAGVECGLFNEKLGKLDMISFGPDLYDVH
ncbi:peptidase dimerization domain-containing protein, partial [Clostridium perfringens]|uniref:peptidase dimerization domain-containing protein n=1 Tax=Clostridium perfringens TaxID=1502 RepID=UPI002ACDCDCA